MREHTDCPMQRFLFVFGFESPVEFECNLGGDTDFESSEAVWVVASTLEEAFESGRLYAEEKVATLYCECGDPGYPGWSEAGYEHWILDNPAEEFPPRIAETFPEFRAQSFCVGRLAN